MEGKVCCVEEGTDPPRDSVVVRVPGRGVPAVPENGVATFKLTECDYDLHKAGPWGLGPVTVILGNKPRESKIMHNGFWYSQLFAKQSKIEAHDGAVRYVPTREHLTWALEGFASETAPVENKEPWCLIWRNQLLKDDAAKELVYISMYVEGLVRSERGRDAIETLQEAWKLAKKESKILCLICADVESIPLKALLMVLRGVVTEHVRRDAQKSFARPTDSLDLPPDFSPIRAAERRMDLTLGGSRIYYRPEFLNRLTQWATQVLQPGGAACIPWKRYTLNMYGREAKEGKLSAFFGDTGTSYRYVGKTHVGIEWSKDPTGVLRTILFLVRQVMGEPYNFVILNWYDGPKSSLGAHSDDTRDLVPGTSIASVTLGAPRPFIMAPRSAGAGSGEVALRLASGSLAVMAGNTQSAYRHSVPAAKDVPGFRINMTFRCVVPGFKY